MEFINIIITISLMIIVVLFVFRLYEMNKINRIYIEKLNDELKMFRNEFKFVFSKKTYNKIYNFNEFERNIQSLRNQISHFIENDKLEISVKKMKYLEQDLYLLQEQFRDLIKKQLRQKEIDDLIE